MNIDLEKNGEIQGSRLQITESMKKNLLEATKWIKFMNVIGSVGIVIMAFVGLVTFFWGLRDSYGNGEKIYIGLIYVAISAVYYPLLKKAFTFVKQARNACQNDDELELEGMFDSLRYVSRYSGIICAVVLGIYALVIIAIIIEAIIG